MDSHVTSLVEDAHVPDRTESATPSPHERSRPSQQASAISADFPAWQVTGGVVRTHAHVLLGTPDHGVMVRSSCFGRDRDQELPVADQRAVRREVRGRGEGDEVVAERESAFGGERLGRFERGPVVGQEKVGEELR
jgi:hypothetical protein